RSCGTLVWGRFRTLRRRICLMDTNIFWLRQEIRFMRFICSKTVCAAALLGAVLAQPPAPGGRGGRGPQGPQVVSPEVLPDHRITFRILAPQAESVSIRGSDIPSLAGPQATPPTFTKGENGVWEA